MRVARVRYLSLSTTASQKQHTLLRRYEPHLSRCVWVFASFLAPSAAASTLAIAAPEAALRMPPVPSKAGEDMATSKIRGRNFMDLSLNSLVLSPKLESPTDSPLSSAELDAQ